MQQKKAIIIGAGVAGLAAATRLAVQGHSVDVFEKNSYPGGKLSAFERQGYHFDAGPSLFTQPANIEALFELAGEPIHDYFQYEALTIACRYFYENGKQVNAFIQPEAFANELAAQLGEQPSDIIRYLRQAESLYNNVGQIFLNHSLHRRSTWLNRRVFKALGTAKMGHLFHSLHRYNQRHFTAPETVQLFNRYATYNGSNPYRAPGMLSMIPHLEQNQGTFYPMGGMISITQALHKLALAKGVRFHFDTPVQRIMHHNGQALGIVANNQNLLADLVVCNVDAYFAYQRLLGNPYKAKQILKQERSSSALIFYWGMGRSFEQLHLHNIFFSNNYQQEFNHLFKTKTLGNDPTVYVNITSKMEPGLAPPGKENWFVMVNAPANTGQDWQRLKEQAKTAVLDKLGRMLQTDLAPLIEVEETLDPILIEERTGSYQGSLYGTSSNSRLAAFWRHPNFTGHIRGLYFCGGSVHPGGGIPLCLKSAQIVADLIQQQNHHRPH